MATRATDRSCVKDIPLKLDACYTAMVNYRSSASAMCRHAYKQGMRAQRVHDQQGMLEANYVLSEATSSVEWRKSVATLL